jgi:hypothetical protein
MDTCYTIGDGGDNPTLCTTWRLTRDGVHFTRIEYMTIAGNIGKIVSETLTKNLPLVMFQREVDEAGNLTTFREASGPQWERQNRPSRLATAIVKNP